MASELPSTNGEMNAHPVLVMVHGGADFSRTFDVFAPLFAAAGWRVVAWDHRSHGDSDHTHLYSFEADLRDATRVLDAVAPRRPVAVLGHSKVAPFSHRLPKHNHFASVPLSTSMAFRIEGPVLTYLSINAPTPSTLKSPAGSSIVVDQLPDHANPAPLKNSHVAEHK